MNTNNEKESPNFLRQEEMVKLLRSEKDPITSHLMQIAVNTLTIGFWANGKFPVSDFDGRFFLEVIQDFCSQHGILRTILAGEGDKIAWFPGEEDQ